MESLMPFRRDKPNTSQRPGEWERWHTRNKEELAAIGLPRSIYSDMARWLDFLENGHLHWHEDPWGFEFGQLLPGQLAALQRFLEHEYGQAKPSPPLLNWVRVRAGKNDQT